MPPGVVERRVVIVDDIPLGRGWATAIVAPVRS